MKLKLNIIAVRLLLAHAYVVGSTSEEERQLQLALVASSPFRMILSRTDIELGTKSLRLVEESISTHLLDQSYEYTKFDGVRRDIVKAVEIIIQTADFQPLTSSSSIKFFALATFTAIADNNNDSNQEATSQSEEVEVSERQVDLNNLINEVFTSSTTTAVFLQLLRDSVIASNDATIAEQLGQVEALVVASVSPKPVPSDYTVNDIAGERRMSSVDRWLIAVSTGILIGIVWMIALYYKDLENYTRTDNDALYDTTGSFPNDAGSFPHLHYDEDTHGVDQSASTADIFLSQPETLEIDPNSDDFVLGHPPNDSSFPHLGIRESDRKNDAIVEQSTGSTPSSSDGTFDRDFSYPPRTSDELDSEDVPVDATKDLDDSGFPTLEETSFLRNSPHSEDASITSAYSKVNVTLTEPFETNVFRMDTTKTEDSANGGGGSTVGDDSDSVDSQDVFQVDVAAAESATGDSASRHSASQEIIDWMKSIHVVAVSGDRSTSIMTTSTEGQASTRSFEKNTGDISEMDSSALDVSSLGQVSLEQSMASSTLPTATASQGTPNESGIISEVA